MYLMYFTDAETGKAYESCGYLPGPRETAWFPADSDEPLPRNELLEAYALHGHKHFNNKGSAAEPLSAEQLAAKLQVQHDSGSNDQVSADATTHLIQPQPHNHRQNEEPEMDTMSLVGRWNSEMSS